MTSSSSATASASRQLTVLPLPAGSLLGICLAAVAVLLVGFLSYQSVRERSAAAGRVTHTLAVMEQLARVLSETGDAETGQRGFLLTGSADYLEPFLAARSALPQQLGKLKQLMTGRSDRQAASFDVLEKTVSDKMRELGETIDLYKTGNTERALALVRTNAGKEAMDRIRANVAAMEAAERESLAEADAAWQASSRVSTRVLLGGSALLLVLIAAAAFALSRDFRARERNSWLRNGQMGLGERLRGDQRLDRLTDRALSFLVNYVGAVAAEIHVIGDDGRLRRVAAYAAEDAAQAGTIDPGTGLVGQAAKDNRILHVRDVPPDFLAVTSSLGRTNPVELLVVPASSHDVVQAVVELGFFRAILPHERELLALVAEPLGAAVRAAKDRGRLEQLLEETQRQAEELQTQQEELRVNNEELEEQGRLLKESQVQLEAQRSELEESNAQLEEHTQLLESQRDGLARAQHVLAEKATELERASQYKSEFLANMSHELRTPLNSTLILAKLLADNKEGNLSEAQVKFAQTILAAGNDLLALINDILDLSKIEAGENEVTIEPVALERMLDSVQAVFQPVAAQKGLKFDVIVGSDLPAKMHTDAQRLAQILKNLLSNAFKFTQNGGVTLQVRADGPERISFAVRDTGIGIPEHQHAAIFEAFRQADGSTHRQYGGTGLGLSISRSLARLLGGDLALQSAPGKGSTFVLTLPRVHAPPVPANAPAAAQRVAPITLAPPQVVVPALPAAPPADDDRDQLIPGGRRILVIEDDTRFALILRDLAREQGFQCIMTHMAAEGLDAALAYAPHAILLDMNLPDQSGMGVLDQLKRNPKTRHIPVHVVSVADHSQQALELGAMGYALKPIQRDEVIDALRRLEAKFSQNVRRVLVVEDDERQRESIRHLLGDTDVQIITVAAGGEALEQLRTSTFDCMVVDLNLPDMSGYDLLEKMAERDHVAFPPVIVYTGRSLSNAEEQRLRRFSSSIIIKDARSPERLLDEVTLFLHQVESKLPPATQRMLQASRNREAALEGRRVLVVEDDVRNIFALTSVLEPKGAKVEIARNGREAIEALQRQRGGSGGIDLVLMDIMMPEMDGITAMREIRKREEWKRLPIIALTAKAMKDDYEKCLAAGANDYIAKPLDIERLLSLVRVWMPKK